MKKCIYLFVLLFLQMQNTAFAQNATASGTVSQVEDAGYPLYVITVNVHNMEQSKLIPTSFNLNVEDVRSLSSEQIDKLKGKHVRVDYEVVAENNVIEIVCNNKRVLEPKKPPLSGGKPFTGILSGAENISQGDLPDTFTVTNDKGESLSFDYFITPEIVAVNGKRVAIYYRANTRNYITNIVIPKIPSSGSGSGK